MRRAFTLIELIFVIIIIGLLAAIAIPKFIHLKQHAEVNSIVKTTIDSAQQAVEAATNKYDLDNNSSFNIGDLIRVTGRGWQCAYRQNWCYYKDPITTNTIAQIKLDTTNHVVHYDIYCWRLTEDKVAEQFCEKLINARQVSKDLPY